MADSGKQSPLGVNVIGSLLAGHAGAPNNTTFYINPVAESYYGVSTDNASYDPGKIVNDTSLKWLTYALKEAWARTSLDGGPGEITNATYDAMLNIGQSRIAALGNSKPPTYQADDPSDFWTQSGAPANSGFAIEGNVDHGQDASWDPWDSGNTDNSQVTKWGWIRALALQAYNEFYWNAKITYPTPGNYTVGNIDPLPSYKDFTSSFLSADAFVDYSNKAITAIQNAQTFLQGTFSNQDDLISADIAGVSLSSRAFGQDLINLGKALDLPLIAKYGLPSALLQTLQKNNAITQNLNLVLLSSGLSGSEIETITNNPNLAVSRDQEQKLYGAFLAVNGVSLLDILNTLNCKTKNLSSLADLLSVKKIFPTSYRTLTVPIYNTESGPTNSKTYYLLFINDELNPQLIIPRVKEIVGTIVPPAEPPIVLEEPVALPIEPVVEPIIPVPPPVTPAVISGGSPPPTTVPTGGGGGGGGCVVLDAYIPSIEIRTHNGKIVEKAWQLEPTFDILLANERLQSSKGKVVKAMIDFQPCVKIVTASGISLSCSTTAPILTKNNGYIEAPKLFGESIAVMRNDIAFYDEVVSISDIGYKHVRVIDTGDNSFWAGDIQNAYVLHHNARIEDALDYDKK